jgi:hypothetical protein
MRRVGAAEIVAPKAGWLHLVPGAETVWTKSPGRESVVVPPQVAMAWSDRKLAFRNQAAFTVVTPDGEHDIAIRARDENLVRLALVTTVL